MPIFKNRKLIAGTEPIDYSIILNMVYPIGSIYMSVNDTNPSLFIGGTWETWGSGKVPVGVDTTQTEFNTVEKNGGAKTHTLTTAQIPAHKHSLTMTSPTGTAGALNTNQVQYNYNGNTLYTNGNPVNETGGGQAHNNLQPYITCFMWKRIA